MSKRTKPNKRAPTPRGKSKATKRAKSKKTGEKEPSYDETYRSLHTHG